MTNINTTETEIQSNIAELPNNVPIADLPQLEASNNHKPREFTLDDLSDWHKRDFKNSKVTLYHYYNNSGAPVGCVVRGDCINGSGKNKHFAQYSWDEQAKKWLGKWSGKNKPLYNLTELLANQDKPILIVEGEKSVEAAKVLFPNFVAVTSCGGGGGAKSTEWDYLAGHDVIISYDNDEAGRKYCNSIKDIVKSITGVKSLSLLHPQKLGSYTVVDNNLQQKLEVAKGYDLADALEEGWTFELIEQHKNEETFTPFLEEISIVQPVTLTVQEIIALEKELTKDTDYEYHEIRELNYRSSISRNRLETLVSFKDPDTGEPKQAYVELSTYIKPTHQVTRYIGGVSYESIVVEFFNRNNALNTTILNIGDLIDDKDTAKIVSNLGVKISRLASYSYKNLMDYLYHFIPRERALATDMIGWNEEQNVYLLPFKDDPRNCYKTSAADSTQYILQSNNARKLERKGSLEEWQSTIGRVCNGNYIFMLAIISALTAPVLRILNEDGVCFHLVGASSIGKSTALYAASSVLGLGKPSSFRTTDNAAESLCRGSNDSLLLLDEIAEVSAESMAYLSYMFGNGSGKARANRDGSAREVSQFRVLALSTGEINLESKLAEKGKKLTAGQNVRFIEIQAEQDQDFKTFNTIHDFDNAAQLAEYIKEQSLLNCGHVIDTFMKLFTENFEEFIKRLNQAKKSWLDTVLDKNSDAQVQRVAKKFALCFATGILAAENGILPFDQDQIAICFETLFHNWINRRGSQNDAFEIITIKERIIELITAHSLSRFAEANASEDVRTIYNLAGYKSSIEFWVDPYVFNKEILEGNKHAVKQLVQDGYILPESNQKYTNKRKPAKGGRNRFYVVPASILNAE